MRVAPGRCSHRLVPVILAGLAAALVVWGASVLVHVQAPATFAGRIAQLSERSGFFDTDNLISNEKSYLHVIPSLHEAGVEGGVYIGVGPDQNFSYIAQVRPSMAFIIDIRRDNLLLHLLFKSLFALSDTRADYLSLLFGRPPPPATEEWRRADLDRLMAHIDSTVPTTATTTSIRRRVDAMLRTFGVPLDGMDVATIDRFHRTFITAGLPLKFETTGRQPQGYYPTYRQLLMETDRQGRRWNYLASEDSFQFVKSLERRDLIIPVVGDLGGPSALASIGKLMDDRGDTLSTFYVSNVEFYLFGDGKWDQFIDNLSRVPHTSKSVLIRSVFGGYVLRESVPGYFSTSLVLPVDTLLNGYTSGRFRSYNDLMLLSRP